MTKFNPLNFIADHAMMNLADAIKEAYEQGKRDAQPEREKGEWIDGFMCSVCRKGYRSQPTIRGVPMFKYCPECGADMRGEQDEIGN